MSNENSNVVSLVEIRQRKIRQRRANVLNLARTMVEEADCDCDLLFGASADEIARLSATLVEHTDEIGDPRNARYINVPSDRGQEDLAVFVAVVAGDVLAQCRADDPTFDRDTVVWGRCLVNARRLVNEL
jgi:hypothetical protein